MTTETMIAELPKNASEVVRVERVNYRGHDLIDARVWLRSVVPGDEPRRTRKGLCLTPALWRELLPMIAQAIEEEKTA